MQSDSIPNEECVFHLHGTIIIDTRVILVSSRCVMSHNSNNTMHNTGIAVGQYYH